MKELEPSENAVVDPLKELKPESDEELKLGAILKKPLDCPVMLSTPLSVKGVWAISTLTDPEIVTSACACLITRTSKRLVKALRKNFIEVTVWIDGDNFINQSRGKAIHKPTRL